MARLLRAWEVGCGFRIVSQVQREAIGGYKQANGTLRFYIFKRPLYVVCVVGKWEDILEADASPMQVMVATKMAGVGGMRIEDFVTFSSWERKKTFTKNTQH